MSHASGAKTKKMKYVPVPDIDYRMSISFEGGKINARGTHDGFPAYQIRYNGKVRYTHDPGNKEDIYSLIGSGEHSFNVNLN
ncbi:hypothetical protein SAMN05444416_11863 [Thermoactinomyces sp. DSM 45892]|nr:hypothetical protein SAMN05444416_11863 [Thermoactinomyces sp. DSM 45892]